MNIPITEILRGKEVREAIQAGINLMNDAVGTTLGARGRMVGIERGFENIILRDGVSVAKSIWLKDKGQRFAANVLREAAQKTVDEVGDGTTVTVILAHAIYTEAEKVVAAGTNPRVLFDEIENDIKTACEELEKMATPITTKQQKIEIATISAQEKKLGEMIGETLDKIGDDGVLTIDKSKNGETYVEMQEGMQWDKGLASPYLINDPSSMTATLEDCPILVTDLELNNMQELLPMLEDVLKNQRTFVLVAPSFGGDALPSLITNKMQNKFMACLVKAPGYGDEQTKMLEDLAILTGATFITQQQGHNIKDVRFAHFGKAEKVTAAMASTIVSGGAGTKEMIDARIKEIKDKLEEPGTADFDKEKLRERLAKLTKGVAVIKVGGATDIEIKERYERALDAGLATREAIKKGIVPGGEIVYLNLIGKVKSQIVKNALLAPFARLVENAGFNSGEMLEKRRAEKNLTVGVDVTTGQIVNMVNAGIVDPVAVSMAALTNGTSVALQLLGTEVLVLQQDPETK